jgi:hypothetical protein
MQTQSEDWGVLEFDAISLGVSLTFRNNGCHLKLWKKTSPAALRLTSKGQNPVEKSVWKPRITVRFQYYV